MALDFHKADNKEYLFGLNDKQFAHLEMIFTEFKTWSGVKISPFEDAQLTTENQKIILQIIDAYIKKTDLNINKQKTIDILEFRAFMAYFSGKSVDIMIFSD